MTSGGKLPSREPGAAWLHAVLGPARGITNLLDWSGRLIVAGTLTFMFLALLINVVLRYTSGSGIPWAYEIHALLLPWLVAGGMVLAAARGRNIAITLLPDMLPARGRLALSLIISVSLLIVSLAVLQSSQPILKASKFQTLSTLGITQIWGYSSLIYAFGATAVISAVNILRSLAGEDLTMLDLENTSLS